MGLWFPMIDEETVHEIQIDFPELVIDSRRHIDLEQALNGHTVTYRFIERSYINTFDLAEGSNVLDDESVLIDASFVETNGLRVGDSIELNLNGLVKELEIKGIVNSPEFAYKSKDYSDIASDKKGFGIVYVSDALLQNILQHSDMIVEAYASIEEQFANALSEINLNLDALNKQQAQVPAVQAKMLQAAIDQLNSAKSEVLEKQAEAFDTIEQSTLKVPELLVRGNEASINELETYLDDKDILIKSILKADYPTYAIVL